MAENAVEHDPTLTDLISMDGSDVTELEPDRLGLRARAVDIAGELQRSVQKTYDRDAAVNCNPSRQL